MSNDKVDTRPKPTKHQKKMFLAISDRISKLSDEEGEYFWKEHPWFEDPTAPRKIIEKPEWEAEKLLLKKKINRAIDELNKIFKEMYPPEYYPELHGAKEQPSMFEDVPSQMHDVPKPEPKTVENMTQEELEAVFGGKSVKEEVVATTPAGAEILKQFQERVNRRRGY